MNTHDNVWSFETENFHVALDVTPEEMDPADSFECQDDIDAVRNGDVEWFAARVTVTHKPTNAILGTDYLSGCAYRDIRRDFIESHWRSATRNTLASKEARIVYCDYFPSMVREAIAEARKQAKALRDIPLR